MFQLVGKAIVGVLKTIFIRKKKCASKKIDMKKLIVIIALLFSWSFSRSQQPTSKQEKPVIYTCVMHPEVRMNKPGNCPKCGMKLVKEKTVVSPQADHQQDSMQMSLKDSATSMGKMDSVKIDDMSMGDGGALMENIKTWKFAATSGRKNFLQIALNPLVSPAISA